MINLLLSVSLSYLSLVVLETYFLEVTYIYSRFFALQHLSGREKPESFQVLFSQSLL